ncbi:MAG: phosphonate ABC transporter, permease protein PhnE [Rickettsiales bacterium]|nr:phosphonate ABC transporter, permease protein PhnE [Rickettsiales bacterium]|tara:strand:+ start:820 stop:1590 length:771 start_codon:yes stop_codon:yes gene_type:complete
MYCKKLKFLTFILIILFLVACFIFLKTNLSGALKYETVLSFFDFFKEFTNPNISAKFLSEVIDASFETIMISFVSTVLSFVFAFFIMISSNIKIIFLNSFLKFFLNFLRSIPDLLWGLILVILFGLGPFTGTLALMLHTTGILGRLFVELLENQETENEKNSIKTNNGTFLRYFLYYIFPEIFPQMLSYLLYRWENNIRAAAILGIIGAGGLGQLLYYRLSLFHYNEVSTILIFTISIVILVDFLSSFLRSKYTGR